MPILRGEKECVGAQSAVADAADNSEHEGGHRQTVAAAVVGIRHSRQSNQCENEPGDGEKNANAWQNESEQAENKCRRRRA